VPALIQPDSVAGQRRVTGKCGIRDPAPPPEASRTRLAQDRGTFFGLVWR